MGAHIHDIHEHGMDDEGEGEGDEDEEERLGRNHIDLVG